MSDKKEKPQKTSISIKIDSRLNEKLRRDSKTNFRTLSGTIEMIISEYYRDKRNKGEQEND